MKRLIQIAFLLNIGLAARGQQVLFDAQHDDDGAIFLQDGIPYNASGEQVLAHEVFRTPVNMRLGGITKSISASGQLSESAAREGGPVFHLTYLDVVNGTGTGFDDPSLGAQRRAALEEAFAFYGSLLEDVGEAEIEIRESFSGHPNSNPFAFAASYYYGSKGFNNSFTQHHLTTGNDPYQAYPDAYIQFNFHPNLGYNYQIGALPSSQQFDFYTVALHEIMHLLGFTSYADASGESAASEHVFTSFDGFLLDQYKEVLFEVNENGNVPPPQDGVVVSDNIWFELNNGEFAPVYAPYPFTGSSLDHFDNGRSEHGEYLMHPSLNKGEAFTVLHDDEVRVLERLGYAVNYSIATSIEDGFGLDAPLKDTSPLYPNPASASDAVRIDLGQVDEREILVIVYDATGRESYSKVILNQGSGPVTAIDPYNNLKPGIYIVIGSTKDELFNQKLVIR